MLTRRGAGAAATVLAGWIGAWGLGYPELSVLGTGAFLALATGSLWLLPSVPLAASRDVAPPKVARGGKAVGVLRVTNTGPRRSRPARAADRCGSEDVTLDVPALPPGLSRTFTYTLPTARRGEIPVGPLRVLHSDPLGLFRRERGHGGQATLLVQPRVLPLTPLPSGRRASLEGPDTEAAPSGTVTFHTLREYVFGDDLRHIHWRTSARHGTLMVRRLVDTSEPRTAVLLDTTRSVFGGDEEFELAVDVAASVAVVAARGGFPVTVDTPGARLAAIRGGTVDAAAVLDRLATVEAEEQGPDMAAALRRITGPSGQQIHGSLVIVTGGVGAPALEQVGVAARRFERAIVVSVGGGADAGAGDRPAAASESAVPVFVVDSAEEFVAAWHREVRA